MLPFPDATPLLDAILDWMAARVLDTLESLWALLARTVFLSPDVTALPQVAEISGRSQVIVNIIYVLAVIAAGVTIMVHESLQVRYGIGELLPRLVIGFIAANFATPICRGLIEAANALTGALTGENLTAEGSVQQMRRIVDAAFAVDASTLLLLVVTVIITVLVGALLALWLMRIVVLIVLVGIAPLALACHALPFTEALAMLWWRAMLGALGTVVVQAATMHTALAVFVDPQANLGLPDDRIGVSNLFVVACLLWITVRIPALMRRFVTRGGGRNPAGMLVRILLAQQISRMVRLPGLGRARAGTGAAKSSAPSAATTVIPYWRPRLPRPASGRPKPARAGGTSASALSTPSSPSAPTPSGARQRTVAAGTTPATAMPLRRPLWQAHGVTPSATGWPNPTSTRSGPRRDGRPPSPPLARSSATGWPSTRSNPISNPRYPAGSRSRQGGSNGQ